MNEEVRKEMKSRNVSDCVVTGNGLNEGPGTQQREKWGPDWEPGSEPGSAGFRKEGGPGPLVALQAGSTSPGQ